jgi:hypothetical protein
MMEGCLLKLIYIFIGISTLVLNFVLTLHIIRRSINGDCKKNRDSEEVITFRLARQESVENDTTAAAACDDTVPLE